MGHETPLRAGVTSCCLVRRHVGSYALVDLSSFHLLRTLGLRSAFTFDEAFREQGFDAVPG
jgi:hypothetical protein